MNTINKTNLTDFDAIRQAQKAETARTEQTKALAQNTAEVNTDKLEVSKSAAEVKRYVEELKKLPDVRDEKVKSVADQIAAGEFKPKTDDIANAILKDEGFGQV